MSIDAIRSSQRMDQAAAMLAAFKQMRQDFTGLFIAMKNNDLAAVQNAVAAPLADQSKLPMQADGSLSSDSPCSGSTSAEPGSWSVLFACSLFACQEKKNTMNHRFALIGAGKRAIIKHQTKCLKCGCSVMVDRTLGPEGQECPMCGAQLV